MTSCIFDSTFSVRIAPAHAEVLHNRELAPQRAGDKEEPGTDFHKGFALGHQFQAFLLHFDSIVSNVRDVANIGFAGGTRSGVSGDYPYGDVVTMIESDNAARPAGLLFEFPDTSPIVTTFADWRDAEESALPYLIRIDDGERVFDYRYSTFSLESRSPLWFFEEVAAPSIDQVQVCRLHRKLPAAHCLGDAKLMADLSAAETVVASRGDLLQVQNNSIRERFTNTFQRLDYTEYHDI